ncbi:hypothetical protein HY990_00160 [Candidatus Micrarchaeota archaeon]|nr:hypothetical protein [Candidatus Micrarchaeota archaeon]
MGVDFSFIAKSTPGILVLGGIMFMFFDQVAKTSFGLTGPFLIGLGVLVTVIWAGVFGKF